MTPHIALFWTLDQTNHVVIPNPTLVGGVVPRTWFMYSVYDKIGYGVSAPGRAEYRLVPYSRPTAYTTARC